MSYEIGIASQDRNRLLFAWTAIAALGYNYDGSGHFIFSQGKLTAQGHQYLDSYRAKTIHANLGGHCYYSPEIRKDSSGYNIGFFNLDDRQGWNAFMATIVEMSTSAPKVKKTKWRVGPDRVAVILNNKIAVGCSVTDKYTIGKMLECLRNGTNESWPMQDNQRYDCGFRAVTSGSAIVVKYVNKTYRITSEQLKEMYDALS